METNSILETIQMISEEKLDIRTITMGISLIDCIDSDGKKARQKIYDKLHKSCLWPPARRYAVHTAGW